MTGVQTCALPISADYALRIADFPNKDLRYLITGEGNDIFLRYRNAEIKPIVEMVDDKDTDTIIRAELAVRAIIDAEAALSQKEASQSEAG